MKYKRNIKFQYYTLQSNILKNNVWVENGSFKFVQWLEMFDKKHGKESIEFDGMKARIECIAFDQQNAIWAVRFMKLRDTNIPSKVREKESAEAIELADDEYIGEDITLLYDTNTGITMIQSNRFSLGISKIENFVDHTPLIKDEQVKLQPIGSQINLNSFKKSSYRAFEITFANLQQIDSKNEQSALMDIIKSFGSFGATTGKVTISLGRSTFPTLRKKEVEEAISEISENIHIKGAKVKVKDDDMSRIEIIDLFDNIVNDIIEFELNARETLAFKIEVKGMKEKFLKRLPELRLMIGR